MKQFFRLNTKILNVLLKIFIIFIVIIFSSCASIKETNSSNFSNFNLAKKLGLSPSDNSTVDNSKDATPWWMHSTNEENLENRYVLSSPKFPWPEFPKGKADDNTLSVDKDRSIFVTALLWVPNRIVDFLDIFKLDVGLGFSFGATVKLTKYAQGSYRTFSPASLRVGNLGRRLPVMLEKSNEIGISPAFLGSEQRKVCKGEFGLGVDPLIAGVYAGICVDEFFDFLAGIVGLEIKNDDF